MVALPNATHKFKLGALRALFNLKYCQGLSTSDIAEKLDLPVFLVECLERELEEYLKAKIKVLSPERLEFVCPECLEARVYEDPETGERVCGNCGTVLENMEYVNHLPFDTTYALTSDLAYDKSLGGTLNGKALMRVLARSPASEPLVQNGNMHLGVRARLAKIMVETFEPPPLKMALKKGYELSVEYGLEGVKLFNHALGKQIRHGFWLNYMLADRSFNRHLAETCFYFTLLKFKKHHIARAFYAEKPVNRALLTVMEHLERLIDTAKEIASKAEYASGIFHTPPELFKPKIVF